jgi:hypothetical protein
LGSKRCLCTSIPIIALVVFAYIAAAEATKAVFYRKIGSPNYSSIARRNLCAAKRKQRLARFRDDDEYSDNRKAVLQ